MPSPKGTSVPPTSWTLARNAARCTSTPWSPSVRPITNAVMHRDYLYDAAHVFVSIFADRLEVENPGGLFSGLSLADLGKRSVRRNRLVADLLFRARYVERVGSGIPRIRQALQENGNPPMEISASNFFVVTFRPRLDTESPLSARQSRLFHFVAGRTRTTKEGGGHLPGGQRRHGAA